MPVYNVEKYVSECVASLVEQTYPQLEIILVDDGSIDSSPALCDEFARQHENISVIHQPNGGLSDARNRGIESARGEWLTFVDSDDYVEPTMIATLYALADENNADISCAGHYSHGNASVRVYSPEEALMHLLREDTSLTTSACGKLFRKSLFNEIRFPKGLIFEDFYTVPRLFDKANRIVHINEPLYFYRQENDSSITHSQFSPKRLEYYTVSDSVDKFLQKNYPALLKDAKNRKTRYSIAFFRQAAQSPVRDKKSEKLLTKHVRGGIVPYLACSYKLTSKAYGVLIALCPPLASKLF